MSADIISAIILASGAVFAAIIGGGSVLIVAMHRKRIIELAKTVEAYHRMETEWVRRQVLAQGEEITEGRISKRRGILRKEILGEDRPNFVSGNKARTIRKAYLSFD